MCYPNNGDRNSAGTALRNAQDTTGDAMEELRIQSIRQKINSGRPLKADEKALIEKRQPKQSASGGVRG